MSSERFRYALEALLRRRRSDWKTVKMEETTASKVVDDRNSEVDQARGIVEETEQSLRHARRDGVEIDPNRQHLLAGYLSLQREVLGQRQHALGQAREMHERIRTSLEGVTKGIKSLEKHREQREADHNVQQGAAEQKRVDELWLLRRRRKEPR